MPFGAYLGASSGFRIWIFEIMKLRFYFDYSDYRSYLMMHSLKALEDLPVSVQWVALDAYSLRALSGSATREQSPSEREFLRREAQRFCMREGIEFVWQAERIHHGAALRAGVWMMVHDAAHFESYSRKILEIMWGMGKTVDLAMLRQVLTELSIHEGDWDRPSERENFQYQDACLQEALADGVFDVPALVIGDEIVCHFDQADEMRRLTLIEWLQSLPSALVCQTFARDLLSHSRDGFRQMISSMTRRTGLRHTVNTQIEGIHAIQHTLAIPSAQWHLSKRPVHEHLPVHVCSGGSLFSAFESALPGAINICAHTGFEYSDLSPFESLSAGKSPLLFYAHVYIHQQAKMLCLRVDAGGKVYASVLDEREETSLQGWWIHSLSPNASRDPNMARLCAHHGAHGLVRLGDPSDGLSEAFGCMASVWVIELSTRGVSIIDTNARRQMVLPGTTVHLDTSFRLSGVGAWMPPPPRTLLLCDKALSFGVLSADANIELLSRGASLLVTTAEQTSELISTRPFERFRVGGDLVLVIPLNAEQLFVTELISYRFLEAFNRAPRESLPIFVSYWSELEFEMLEVIRPVLAAIVSVYRIPIVLVVGTQVVETWLANAHGQPYHIEKEDDCFSIDISELIPNEHCFSQMMHALGIDKTTFLARLQSIEEASRK